MSRARSAGFRLIAILAAAGAIAACDATSTAPTAGIRSASRVASIEGDTLACGERGWQIMNGRYECNPE